MARYTEADRTLALAGLFQAAANARDLARNGTCDPGAFTNSRESLFDFDPASVASVFGGVQGVTRGLRALLRHLDQPKQHDLEISRYVIALMHLSDRLRRDRAGMSALHDDLSALARRRDHIELTDAVVHLQLEQIYQTRISVLGPRIMVRGDPLHLQNPDKATRIRVALLAGIRAAILWRQAGGRKWQLLLRRRVISVTARTLLDQAEG